ncbi:hypothetical protein [Streptomyces parvulus]|uniref:hypothetical protein n=1 Tax=Streptomyces parvulus TaxID=146923 RepID=UPI00343B4734
MSEGLVGHLAKARGVVVGQSVDVEPVLAQGRKHVVDLLSLLGQQAGNDLDAPCARLGPPDGGGADDGVAQATRITLRMLAERIEQLTAQINELNQRLTRLVEHHAPQLLEPVGIGPDSAVTLLITMGDDPSG